SHSTTANVSWIFFLPLRRPPSSPLFPYTTLFRSIGAFLPRDHTASRAIVLQQPLERVWATIRNLEGTAAWFPEGARVKVEVVERSEEHTSELQSRGHLVCRLLLEKKKTKVVKPRS